jgi:hypothetical protein
MGFIGSRDQPCSLEDDGRHRGDRRFVVDLTTGERLGQPFQLPE